ncbi:hypothetical protein PAF17_13455 [Paracoccus sp. Z330]|uniref:Uncharacterized protein n=1 Tax=Paracoccus onchidii TaxID=3017813 RepID=A0ABT4ZGW1_9RHOB|nr:hypothetical protein [Paracoccus onchidii]MDB6178504.1 hypothetical protein [Paracoccus onchidii]
MTSLQAAMRAVSAPVRTPDPALLLRSFMNTPVQVKQEWMRGFVGFNLTQTAVRGNQAL